MKRLAAVLVIVLALAGCATTGQLGDPGQAAEWNGTVVTNDEISDFMTGARELHLLPDAGAALTLLLLEPTITRFAADNDAVFTDAEIEADAAMWLETQGTPAAEVTPEMIHVLRLVRAFGVLVNSEDFIDAAIEDWNSIEQTAVISPLYGTFAIDVLGATLSNAHTLATSPTSQLGSLSYLEYTTVSAFDTDAAAPWVVSEAPAPLATAVPAG